MKYVARSALSAILASVMITALFAGSAYSQRKAPAKPAAKAPASIYDQGYQKGYGDGFAQGQADWRQGAPRDFQSSDGFRSREQKFDPRHAANGEYIEGYDLGFEIGHTDGYYGRARNAAIPANGAVLAKAAALANAQRAREQQQQQQQQQQSRDDINQRNDPPPQPVQSQGENRPRTTPTADIPGGTALEIRLTSTIDTKNNRSGDRFEAVVVSPDQYRDAVVEGHIANINRSGRVTGRTELALAFDRIRLQDGRELPLEASLEKIIESETVKKVDEEGNVQSGSRSKDAQMRGGVGAAAGAVIGGIIGGVKGAVLGAVIGGAGGVGTVYVEGDKDLVLEPGTEMIIRTERTRRR
ncbi:MAG TPA: hypothetical protein VF131_05410 [Blastocatellia bacterium]|nr:hypothetical protein [Blastocatellia bacterium]